MKNGLSILLLVLAMLMAKTTANKDETTNKTPADVEQTTKENNKFQSPNGLVEITNATNEEGYVRPDSVHLCEIHQLDDLKLSKSTSAWTPNNPPTIMIDPHHNIFSRVINGDYKNYEMTLQLYSTQSTHPIKSKKNITHTPEIKFLGAIVTSMKTSSKDEKKRIQFKLPPHLPAGEYYIVIGQRHDENYNFATDGFISIPLTNEAYEPVKQTISELNLISINAASQYIKMLPQTFKTLRITETQLLPTTCNVCKLIGKQNTSRDNPCGAISALSVNKNGDSLTMESVCNVYDLSNQLNDLKFRVFGLQHAKLDSSFEEALREILKNLSEGTNGKIKSESYFTYMFCDVLTTNFAIGALPNVYSASEKKVMSDVHSSCNEIDNVNLTTIGEIMDNMMNLAVPKSMVIDSPQKTDQNCNAIALKVDQENL